MIPSIRQTPLRLFLVVAVALCGLMTLTDLPSAALVHAQEQQVTATRDATGDTPPDRPTNLQASAEHDSVSLTWTASTDQSVTHYAVLRRDRNADDVGVFHVIDSNAGSGASYTDDSVSPEGSYVYRVKAVSPTGVSQWSSYVSVNTPAAPSPTPEPNPEPGPDPDPADLAPGSLSAKAVSGDDGVIEGVALAWDAPAEDAASVTGYEVLRAVGDGDMATLVADTGSDDTTYTDDTATEAGESYAYRVKALRGEEASQPSDRALAIIPKTTPVEPEPRIAEEQNAETTLVSNHSLTGVNLGLGDFGFRASMSSQAFTTGSNTNGYNLSGLEIYLRFGSGSHSLSDLKVSIWTDSSGVPNSEHVVLVNPATAPGTTDLELVTLTAPANTVLAAETTYHVVVRNGASSGTMDIGVVTDNGEEPGGAAGWSIADGRRSRSRDNISASWSAEAVSSLRIRVTDSTGAAAEESAETTVPADWGLIPGGLGAGDRFRLVFLSSTIRDGSSSDIADYNTFVQTAAASGHADIQSHSSTFRVVGSTADVDARDNTDTTYTADDKGVAIYWLGGNKVADEYEDFYDEDWDDEANAKNESGNNRSTSGTSNHPFTGSDHDGTAAHSVLNAPRALGATNVRLGRPNSSTSGHGPLSSDGTRDYAEDHPLYGLSGVFVVAGTAVTSTDATLSALSLSGVTLSPSFAADTLAYTASVGSAVDSTTVTATANDDGATLEITPGDADGATDGHQVALGVGDTTVSVTVTATDGASMQTYAVTVTRAEPVEVESITMRRYDSRDGEPYRIGDQMVFVVKFSHVVWCVSQPPNRLRFHIGTSRKEAGYLSGFGSDNLWYRYTVQEGDLDTDGITIPPGPEALPDEYRDSCTAGTTFDESGVTAQGPLEDRKVDGVRPTVAEDGAVTSDDGLQILLTFSEPLHMTTAPASAFTLAVNTGTAPAVNSATASGDKVTLGLAGALTSRQAVTVTYTDPMSDDDDDAVQDVVGNDAETFTTGEGDVPAVANAVTVPQAPNTADTVVPPHWGLIPSGLGGGDRFRLIFRSSGTRDASSTDIADYNTFVQTAAANGHTDIQSHSSTFNVLGSTAADDARDNTSTTFTDADKGVRIYWLNGGRVADDYEDFYDGSWSNADSGKDEDGADRTNPQVGTVAGTYTGSTTGGREALIGGTSRALGTSNVRVGRPLGSDTNVGSTTTGPFYGLSGVFVVGEAVEVPATWSLIPSGLGAGDRFRLIFLSSTTRHGAATHIADYNGFVQTRAATGHADIQRYSSLFRVVGSTYTVDARDNTITTYTDDDKGVPIYWLGGNRVAVDYENFYDGDWDDEANAKDESGNNRSTSGDANRPFTGSEHNGTEDSFQGSSRALGAPVVRVGRPNDSGSNNGPLSSSTNVAFTETRPLYGLSGVFVVEGAARTNAAPEFTSADTFIADENQTAVGTVMAMDADSGDTVSYAITGGDDQAQFQIVAASGVLTFATAPDHESPADADMNDVYLVTATATGGTGARALTTEQDITVIVDDVDETPAVASVDVTSTPTATADTYGRDETIEVTVTFDQAVTVTGTPRIRLRIGGGQQEHFRWADYADGADTALVFAYTVQAGDQDDNGIYIQADELFLNNGTIQGVDDDVAASLTYTGPGAQSGHKVDGSGCLALPEGRLWSACLTAGEIDSGGRYGYQSPSVGSLAPGTFDVGATTYTVTRLFDNDQFGGSTFVRISLRPILSEDDASSLTLHLGTGTSLSFGDASYSTGTAFSSHSWSRSDALGWSAGQKIVVGITQESTPTPVPTTWSLVPSGLGDGDSFRLLFIGSSNRDANSSDIAVYNTFIQNLVDTNGHADIQAHSATFRMLGSTEDVDARDNTGTTGTGVPIYWLNGAKVADDYADFYDGSWNEEATGARETGVSVSIASSWKIWTGSAQDGTEAMNAGGTESRALGNAGGYWVMQGSPNGSDSATAP